MNEDQFKKLRREVEESKAEADQAQGALNQLMQRIKEEYDCGSLKEARASLAELQEKKEKAERIFDKLAKDYEKKWKVET